MKNSAIVRAIKSELKCTYPGVKFNVRLFNEGESLDIENNGEVESGIIEAILSKYHLSNVEISIRLTPKEIEAREAERTKYRAEWIKFNKSPEGIKKAKDEEDDYRRACSQKFMEDDCCLSYLYNGIEDDGGVYDEEDDIMRALSKGEGDKIGRG